MGDDAVVTRPDVTALRKAATEVRWDNCHYDNVGPLLDLVDAIPATAVLVDRAVLGQVRAALLGLAGRVEVLAESPNRRQALEMGHAALAALDEALLRGGP
jgi:hypothetical protein